MKFKIFFSLFVVLTAFSLISCETNKHVLVTVLNSATNQPIDSVMVNVNAGKNGDYNKSTAKGYTDENGKYESYLMIGCSFGCYDIYIEYTKTGFKTKRDLNITEGTVFLSPE